MRTLKKKPIQIYIEPKQEVLLEQLARERGSSKAEIIRLSIDKYISELPIEKDPAMGIIGLGKSGKKDISEKHDIYIAEHVSGYGKKKRK
ncbi:MAG: CopG family transcriptional regulator [Nitrospirae bacterium]|nr:CopG family transcriptional regulator [Nitrospirota bacterium]